MRRIALLIGAVVVAAALPGSVGVVVEAGADSAVPAAARANGDSVDPAISADGRFITFTSRASNLVVGDTNRCNDDGREQSCDAVFVRDRVAKTTTRVSVSSSGEQANDHSRYPAISSDGRFVVFTSRASTLAGGDKNDAPEVFVHDRRTRTTTRLAASFSAATISGDGRYVAFSSNAAGLVAADTNGRLDVFVRDRRTGTSTRVSVGGNEATGARSDADEAAISGDGRVVAFVSDAWHPAAGSTDVSCATGGQERRAL